MKHWTTEDYLKQAEWVEWVDHVGDGHWQPVRAAQETPLSRCHSLGIVLHEDDEKITLAQSLDVVHGNAVHTLTIAKALVVRRWRILG